MKIEGKKIIVTGGASGIGKELVKRLIKGGALVSALDINEDNLKKLEIEINSQNLKTYVVDIGSKDSIINFSEKYITDNTYVDILINNAGIIQPFVDVSELDDATINRVMNINFYGPLNLTRQFLKILKERDEAYIINVSSMGGFFPFPRQTVYGASKAAIKLFTEGLYAELLDTNVKVMVVFPGAINTNITQNSNVSISANAESYKMTSASDAAKEIIKGINKNKFKLFIGSDSKFMNWFYNFNSKLAIKTINNKMKSIK